MMSLPLSKTIHRCLALVALLAGTWSLSSCSSGSRALETVMESKEGSLGDWKNLYKDGEPLLQAITRDTALLLSPGEGLVVASREIDGDALQVAIGYEKPVGRLRTTHGAAVPITRDGYFLTALHCLEGPRAALIVVDVGDGEPRAIKPEWRVVWKSRDKRELDLALIHAPVRLGTSFSLVGARGLEQGSRVAVAGWSSFFSGQPMGANAAGRIVGVSPDFGQAPGPRWQVLSHDVPLHPGDSGGPLIDRSGRLVGINGAMRFSRFAAIFSPSSMQSLDYLGEAVAPDPDWIHSLIRADRKARKSRR